jgi:hypothetical protein
MRILFLFLTMVLPLMTSAVHAETPAQLATQVIELSRSRGLGGERQWRRLMHFKVTPFGVDESQIDSANFFISKNGKSNAQAELETFVQKIFESPLDLPEPQALQCRFPARYQYLKNKLKDVVKEWPDRVCPTLDRWFETLRGTSVSLVFSSYYLNNPSSTFGHTLLRVNKAPSDRDGQRYELLDYGINFAANANTSNPFLYSYMGLFGGFPGTFTTVPYYYKVREYNNSESRDLWEYELNIDSIKVDLLVKHIWEVGPTYADYWYLTENCSYFIFTLLEAADPDLDLTSRLKKFVIPTDTVQVAWQTPGFVRSVHFRPSVRSELYERLKVLTDAEKDLVAETVKKKELHPELKKLSEHRRRLVLDAAIDDMDFLYAVPIQTPTTPEAQFKNLLLGARSQIDEISERLKIQPSYREAPHNGHGSRRLSLGGFNHQVQGSGALLGYKFALHDLLDPIIGYPEYAQISFFDLKFSYFDQNKVTGSRNQPELENFMLFEVISLSPYTQFSKSVSWRLHVGVERMINEDCMGCHAWQVTGGPGYTLRFLDEPLLVGYLGIKGGFYYTARGGEATSLNNSNFPRWLIGMGPNLTFRARWSDRWVSVFEGWVRKDQKVSYSEYKEVSLSTQWSPNQTWGLRATGVDRWFEKTGSLEFLYYY